MYKKYAQKSKITIVCSVVSLILVFHLKCLNPFYVLEKRKFYTEHLNLFKEYLYIINFPFDGEDGWVLEETIISKLYVVQSFVVFVSTADQLYRNYSKRLLGLL